MDITNVKELIDFRSNNEDMAVLINPYLKAGWGMIACCVQYDEAIESNYVYALLGWFLPSEPVYPHN